MIPSKEELARALNNAGAVHHDYQTNILNGLNDEQWAGFYAAFVIGHLGVFAVCSELTVLLVESPSSESWSNSAAEYVLGKLEK